MYRYSITGESSVFSPKLAAKLISSKINQVLHYSAQSESWIQALLYGTEVLQQSTSTAGCTSPPVSDAKATYSLQTAVGPFDKHKTYNFLLNRGYFLAEGVHTLI